MNVLSAIGAFISILGIVVVLFRRPISAWFCRLGKALFKMVPPIGPIDIESIYDEAAAPRRFLFMGIVSIVQGLVILLLGFLLRDHL